MKKMSFCLFFFNFRREGKKGAKNLSFPLCRGSYIISLITQATIQFQRINSSSYSDSDSYTHTTVCSDEVQGVSDGERGESIREEVHPSAREDG